MSLFNNDKSKKDKRKRDQEFVHEEGEFDDIALLKVHSQLMRENSEPHEQMAPIPLALLFVFAILLFWGGFYLATFSGKFRSDVFDPYWMPTAQKVERVFDPLSRGKKLFSQVCQQCHQADGMGLPGVYPPIAGSPWLLTSEARPVKLLLKGLSGPVTVMGKQFNGNMPAIADWKDRDIAAVLTFVRQHWENDAGPISEEFVAEIREEIADRKKPWTSDEILKLHPL